MAGLGQGDDGLGDGLDQPPGDVGPEGGGGAGVVEAADDAEAGVEGPGERGDAEPSIRPEVLLGDPPGQAAADPLDQGVDVLGPRGVDGQVSPGSSPGRGR